MARLTRLVAVLVMATLTASTFAGDDPAHERHELMEDVGKAAKPIGKMFKGESEFDAEQLMASLQTFQDAGMIFGDLFPAGSEPPEDSEWGTEKVAALAIWEDREGFDAALADWVSAVDAAIAANPQTLDDAQAAVGPVFKTCKGCHDNYRIETE